MYEYTLHDTNHVHNGCTDYMYCTIYIAITKYFVAYICTDCAYLFYWLNRMKIQIVIFSDFHIMSPDFRPLFVCSKDSTWTPYEQAKMDLRSFSFSQRYLILKFENCASTVCSKMMANQ